MFKAVQTTVKSRIITVTSLCLIVLLMGIFFASQSYSVAVDAVKINKGNNVEEKWEMVLDSYKESEGSVQSTSNKVLSNVVINEFTLNSQEYIEYTVMLENKGNMDALLKNVSLDGIDENVNTTIKVNAEAYDPSTEITLGANSKNYVTIRVEAKEENIEPLEYRLVTAFDIVQK
ncbi:MAG: hypothetical protein II625_06695 [Bacilli bacterium]|nr:hypothetical protein [Bacilli bacterium]